MALLPLSLQAVYDGAGNRVFDALLIVTGAGTNVPAPAYADAGLSTLLPSPIKIKGNGTWPVIFVAPGSYRLRSINPDGFVYDTIEGLTIDAPSSGSGGGGTVDETRLAQTGDIKYRYGIGSHPDWLRCNGRTIGSAASSATERANDDCLDLFIYLYTQDPNLAVSGGRGDNAQSDWEAGKTIALPDARGRTLVTLDDLGTAPAGRLTGGLFTFGNATTLGSYGGEASHVQTLAEMASHNHTATGTMSAAGAFTPTATMGAAGGHAHDIPYRAGAVYQSGSDILGIAFIGPSGANSLGTSGTVGAHTHTITVSSAPAHTHAMTVSVASRGSSAAMNWLPPFLLISTYIKL